MSPLTLFVLLLMLVISPISAQPIPPSGALLLTTNGAQNSILLIDPDSGQIRSFSLGDGIHTAWGFSPDGCRVLLTVMDRSGLARAYTSLIDGSGVREIVSYDEIPRDQWGVWEPTWSPVGDKIAFTLLRDGFEGVSQRQYHIAWVSPDGGQPTFYSRTGQEHSPVWSPDGAQLAYVSYEQRIADEESAAPGLFFSEADIWIVGADGDKKFRATAFETGSARDPKWSPSGEWLSFVMSPTPGNDTLWAIRLNTGEDSTQITYAYNLTLDHTWLPDSSALLVSARNVNDTDTAALWTFPIKESADGSATQYASPQAVPYPDYPAFSPDGTRLALRSGYRMAILESDDSLTIIPEVAGNMPVYWSPASLTSSQDCTD